MHVIVWEFFVPEEHRRAFEEAYGPAGDWAVLFKSAPGYISTELLRDEQTIGRYLTIDNWDTAESFSRFKEASKPIYDAMDKRFEGLTSREIKIGTFEKVI
jgi:heme-degrading monooxygenase HmoA